MQTPSDWDDHFRRGRLLEAEPDSFLIRCAEVWGPPSGRFAADIACGAGRNAAFLAHAGFSVTAVDFSAEALQRTKERAGRNHVATLQIDLESPAADLGEETFDLVCVIRYLHRPLFPVLRRAVKPGGLLIYHTYTTGQLAFEGGPRNPRFLLQPGELTQEFAAWRMLRYEVEWRGRGTAALLARKP